MSQIYLHGLTPEEFKELFLEAFQEASGKKPEYYGMSIGGKTFSHEDDIPEKKEEYLTRKQAAKVLQISLPTLHQYTKQGLITSFRLGNKVRYKESDIKAALKERNYERRAS